MDAGAISAFVPFLINGIGLSRKFFQHKTPFMHSASDPPIKASILNLDDEISACIEDILQHAGCDYSVAASAEELDLEGQAVVFVAGGAGEEARDYCRRIYAAAGFHQPVITLVLTNSDIGYDEYMKVGADDIIHFRGDHDYCATRVKLIMDRARARAMRWIAEDALTRSTALASAVLETTVDGIVTIDEKGSIETVNSAIVTIFGYEMDELIGENVSKLMPEPFRSEHGGYIQNFLDTGHKKIIGIGREVLGQRKDGSIFPLDLAVSEVTVGNKRMFTGILRDISERRQLEQEILRISDAERQRIGHDLHDGLGQMLTGIGLITQNLSKRARSSNDSLADEISEVSGLVKEADQQARTLARNLTPVDLEAAGLDNALGRLAHNAGLLFGIRCRYEANGSVTVDDNSTATHLFRIAQEAISNAVSHGEADVVRIELSRGTRTLRLRIIDNGRGFQAKKQDDKTRGMGVHIMNYRARMIGGSLDITPSFDGGTVVTCTVRTDMTPPRQSASPKQHAE